MSKLAHALRRLAGETESSRSQRSMSALALFAGSMLAIIAVAASNILLGLGALIAPRRRVEPWLRRGRPLLIAIGIYLLALVASILASHDPRVSLRSSSDLFNFLVPVLALALVRNETQARRLIQGLIVVGCLVAGHALVQYWLGADHIDDRPVGPFSHYMTLGGFLLLVDCLLLAWMAFSDGWRRWWSWPAALLLQAALVLSLTRNAWVALAVILSVLAAVRAPRLLLAWAPVVVVVAIVAPAETLTRVTSITDLQNESNYDRLCMLYAGAGMVLDKPVLGQGPRMARERYPLYRHPTAPRSWVPHLHNSFLNIAAERGLVSLLAMLAILWMPARRVLQITRGSDRTTGSRAAIYAGTVLVLLATVITGLFEDYWTDTEIQRLVLFVVALPFCLDPPLTGRSGG